MRISFTKGSGKFDYMRVHRGDATEVVDCPKQRIIPHDMVHFAVESILAKRGFLGRIHDGEAARIQMRAESESDGIERLVEVFQADAWSGGTGSPADLLELYEVTCCARQCPPLALTSEDILAIRDLIGTLDRQWQALPVGQTVNLEFQAVARRPEK